MSQRGRRVATGLVVLAPLAFAGGEPDAETPVLDVPGVPLGVLAADVDGDARVDLVAWLDAGTARLVLLRSEGDGRFAAAFALPDRTDVAVTALPRVIATDIDRDGDVDLVGAGPAAALWRNDGAGHFVAEALAPDAPEMAPDVTVRSEPFAVADLDGDALLDLATVTTTPRPGISLLLSRGTPPDERSTTGLVLGHGRLLDRPLPNSDRLLLAGELPDGMLATREPIRLTVSAGDSSFDATLDRVDDTSFRSSDDTSPRVRARLDPARRRFALVADAFDIAAAPGNPVTVTLTAGGTRWRHSAAWKVVRPGELRWTASTIRATRGPESATPASAGASPPFELTSMESGGRASSVLREKSSGRTWRFDAATGRWLPVAADLAKPSVSLDAGLVAFLPFDTDLADGVGKGDVVNRGGVEIRDGEAHFDGSGWLEMPHVALNGTHAFSMWVRPAGDSQVMGLVEQRDANAGNRHYHLMLRGNSQPYLGFYLNDLVAPGPVGHDAWHHLVFQHTGSHQEIWVDGARVAARAAPAYAGTTGATRIGRNPGWTNVGGTHFVGSMRRVRVYGRGLSADEIAELGRRETPPESARKKR